MENRGARSKPKVCGVGKLNGSVRSPRFRQLLSESLHAQRLHLPTTRIESFAMQLDAAARYRTNSRRELLGGNLPANDIISLILKAWNNGDHDEAYWRAFLAGHFGRNSPEYDRRKIQIPSSANVLNAFGNKPIWTWNKVTARLADFRKWLLSNRSQLRSIAYGNHRKYESKQPAAIYKVLYSFITLAMKYGGPAKLFQVGDKDLPERFDVLYKRLEPLKRFGRTGRFDLLGLLVDLRMLNAEPTSCYLRGSTGPKNGARFLWDSHDLNKLDTMASDLAARLGISCFLMEDALCNWQKS